MQISNPDPPIRVWNEKCTPSKQGLVKTGAVRLGVSLRLTPWFSQSTRECGEVNPLALMGGRASQLVPRREIIFPNGRVRRGPCPPASPPARPARSLHPRTARTPKHQHTNVQRTNIQTRTYIHQYNKYCKGIWIRYRSSSADK